MQCPPEILTILTEIISIGLVNIRTLGSSGDAKQCAIEADHLHNLPNLITNYQPELLVFYWNIERPAYLRANSTLNNRRFNVVWLSLAEFIKKSTVA